MRSFYAETVVQEDGKVTLNHLPFHQGDILHIFISDRQPASPERHALHSTVLKYDRPFDPVAHDEWAAGQ